MISRGILISAVAFAIYALLVPTHVVDGESAEFATLGAIGGPAHPSGYPLYLLWLRAWSWLPTATAAHAAGLATALLAAVQLAVLHAACRAWGARPAAASFAIAIYGAAPLAVRYHSQPEVFALNGLIVVTVLWLSAQGGPLRGSARVIALGVVAGLGLAHHTTCVLVAPLGLLGAIRGVRESDHRWRAAAAGVVAFVIGLAPYCYLLITPANPASWGDLASASDLLDHALRRAYGGPTAFASRGSELAVIDNVVDLGATLARSWLVVPLIGGGVLLAARCRSRSGNGESVWGWRMLALSFVLAGPLVAARIDLPRTGELSHYIIERFHLLPITLLAIPIASAFDTIGARVAPQLPRLTDRRLLAGLAALVLVAGAAAVLPSLARVRSPALENAVRSLLRSLPPDAVVITNGDVFHTVPGYLQLTAGERPDVTIISWPLVGVSWYRERLAQRGIVIDPTARSPGAALVDRLLGDHRPLFVDPTLGSVNQARGRSEPYGLVFRIVPRGDHPLAAGELFARNYELFRSFDLEYPRPEPDDDYPAIIHERYAYCWRAIADRLAGVGSSDAALALALAKQLAPQ